ncbi:MAG: glycosyltransferase family 2 protein [Methanolobus sp.]|uniref:glycosyltransferase family 2 protein n=1 Tax=Methanolobus sp. TaxID=1874737 RepID=UPI002730AEAC|nr:glycosyltransferase family 2 protein [Methanolobus sp.]MDP2217457.1 glycosyltransferase family 2 protein [Methanolobus sp.]
MSSAPLISVVIAVYNGSKTLQRCIDSVSAQTYLNKELVIVDGGSTDSTIDILLSNNDKIAYWKSEPDKGIYNAWNKALDHITGDWIYFLGCDDYLWKDNVFEELAPHLVRADSENIKLVYGQVARVTENKEVCCIDGCSWDHTWRGIIVDGICAFTHQGMFQHHSLFDVYGKFDESFKIAGDYELLVRAFKEGGDAYFIEGLVIAGMQTGGITKNCTKLVKETAAARRNNQLKVVTVPWLISYSWAISYPLLYKIFGDKNTRSLLNFGKDLVTGISHKKSIILREHKGQ